MFGTGWPFSSTTRPLAVNVLQRSAERDVDVGGFPSFAHLTIVAFV